MEKIRIFILASFLVCNISAQTPAGNNQEIQFNNNGVFGSNSLFKFTETTLRLDNLGTNSIKLDLRSEASDRAEIYSENYQGTDSRLVFETRDDGDADYSVFRNTHWNIGSVDVFEIHRSFVQSNSDFYLPTSRLGIGTSKPLSQLHVTSDSENNITWPLIVNNPYKSILDTSSPYGVGIKLKHSESSDPNSTENNKWSGIVSLAESSYANTSSLAFYADENEKMRILSNGYLGIGTKSPTEKFQIGNSYTFHDGGDKVIGFLCATGGKDLDPSSHAAEIRFSPSLGSLTFGTSTAIDNQPTRQLTIGKNGNVGIGTTTPDSKLAVNGKIHTQEVKVDLIGWADYVFAPEYDLPTLQEAEAHIKEHGHLLDIPSAEEVVENGILLGEMNAKLLQKIEELTLYTIEQEKQLEKAAQKNKELEGRLERLEKLLK